MEKSDLEQYRMLGREICQINDQLRELESSLYSPKGQRFSHTPKAQGAAGYSMDSAIANHVRLADLYAAKLAEREAQQLRIEQAIDSLDDTVARQIMRDRYISGLAWWRICRELESRGYSERTVYRLHGEALLKLREV